jgi:hypothetical protein
MLTISVQTGTAEWMARIRGYLAEKKANPPHDSHVKVYRATYPHAWDRRMRICSCGAARRNMDWPKDRGGRPLVHCGCTASFVCRACGKQSVRKGPATGPREQKLCSACRSHRWLIPEERESRIAKARIARRIKSRAKHEAHVIAWANHWRAQRRFAKPHSAHVSAWRKARGADAYRIKYRNDPHFNLQERIRRQLRKKLEAVPGCAELIRSALANNTGSNRIEKLFGYSIDELRRHLERQFVRGMSWDNMARRGWHIDHIHPRKCFDTTTIAGLRAYWALPNLRPLWAKANLAKRDRVETLL